MSLRQPAVNSQTSSIKSIEYSQTLIRQPSITPDDMGCQDWLSHKLTELGFRCHRFNVNGVSNLIAQIGQGEKTLAFAGHTDVVPPGPMNKWRVNPFSASIIDGELIGRGAADMKTGLAAMLAATERHIQAGNAINQRFVWLITSDEEGEAEDGSKLIAKWLADNNIQLDYCIVGEPTAQNHTGDVIKVGRRGAISAKLSVHGIQGHVAYPQYADNAIHKMGLIISRLNQIEWDIGSEDFPGTGLQITHINSGQFTDNIVPAHCEAHFNIRYSHNYSQQSLSKLIERTVSSVTRDFKLEWDRPCEPYFTANREQNCLIHAAEKAIFKNLGKFPRLSTSGGTSDGRFFSSAKTQVVELGVPNQSIHQINERSHIADIVTLEDIYTDLLAELL